MLCTTTYYGRTPQQVATISNRPDPIISLLTGATVALTARDYVALAARVQGDVRTIRFLCDPRFCILCCLKHGRPDYYNHDGDGDTSRIVFSFLE